MNIFGKLLVAFFKKKRLAYKTKEADKTGFILGENFTRRDNSRVLNLFIRMLMVDCFALGTIDAFMSSFNIPYNAPYVFGFLAALSFVLMLFQHSLVTRIAAYAVAIWRLSVYYTENTDVMRSGLNALTNQMYELVRVKFKLPATDGFPEMVADRNITVTTVLIVVGVYYTVFLWESCGRTMNITISGMISLTVISMGLYFGGVPSFASMLMLSAAWLVTACIKLNGRYVFSFGRKKQYRIWQWGNEQYYHKLLNGKAFAQFFVLVLTALTLALGAADVLFTPERFEQAVPETEEKQYSDFLVKDMMITAFSHYKNYSLQTLASSGQLGQYASVEPDGLPDLEVTFMPEKPGRQYLKSFVGTDYENSMWVVNGSYADEEKSCGTASAAKAAELPARKMEITDLDIVTSSPFLPYYTDNAGNDDIIFIDDTKNEFTGNMFAPYSFKYYSEPDVYVDDAGYREYVYENYLAVPDQNREPIEKLCAQKGFSADDPELDAKLAEFFETEFRYSLNPGLVPWKTDFVNYFLFENKVGLCAHFASAGTLIYRTLGIPARYVEGYALDYAPGLYEDEEVLENEDPLEWTGGGTAITPKPVKVQVSDISAHGWVEIYKDNYGWVPVELTPGTDELEAEKKNDERLGTKLMEIILNSRSEDMTPEERSALYKEAAENIGIYVFALIAAIILAVLVFGAFLILFRHAKRLFVFSRRDASAVIEIYTYIMRVLEFLGRPGTPSHKQMCAELAKYMRSPEIVTETVEKILYSPEPPDDEECLNAFIGLHTALGRIYKEAGMFKTAEIILKL